METIKKINKVALVLFLFSILASCNQQEFYEKEFLEGAGVSDEFKHKDVINDPTSGDHSDPTDNIPDIIIVEATPTPTSGDSGDNANPTDDDNNNDPIDDDQVADNPTDGDNGADDNNDDDSTDNDQVVDNPTNDGSDNNDDDPADDNNDDDQIADNPNDGGNNNNDDPAVEEPAGPVLEDRLEKFVQNSEVEAKVDILWVIDDSGSMGDEQAALAYNFDVFIHQFLDRNVDFHMGITTTDATSERDGKMIGDSKKLTSEAAKANEEKFIRDFSSMIKVGTKGSGREMGLRTSSKFLKDYASQGNLKDWMREEAYLIVVYVSDEEDQSEESVTSYVNSIKELKSNKGKVKLNSIVVKSLNGNKWETVGTRYLEASHLTGGEAADIKKDFYNTLKNMGGKIVDLLDSFSLAETPYANIDVTVDGEKVSSGWTFIESSRSVKFDKDSLPREGAAIAISYQVEKGSK